MLSGLLRRPFAELYLTYPGAALRLSVAIFTTIVHDRISQSWKARDSQSRSNWEQIAMVLLAGVQVALDHIFWWPSVAYCLPLGPRGSS